MAIKDGFVRWSDDAVGAIRWDTEEKEGLAVVIDEANGEVYEIGGGGESDFSTAKLTISATGQPYCENGVCVVTEDDPFTNLNAVITTDGTYDVILYKGSVSGAFYTSQEITTYSGDISLGESELEEGAYYTPFEITGDCSVTLVGEEDV